MMKRLKLKFLVRVVAFGVPYAVLMIVGAFWLQARGLLLPFVVAASLLSVLQWLVLRWLNSRPVRHEAMPPPSKTWPAAGEQAWNDVDQLAARIEANMPSPGDANVWSALFLEVLNTVAKRFHPESKRPVLEVTVSQAIRIIELVARDLRTDWQQRMPGAEQITMHHVYRAIEWAPAAAKYGQRAWSLVRLGRLVSNPARAIATEIGAMFAGGSSDLATELPALAAGYCVRRAGRYAIDLYSGQLEIADATISTMTAAKPLRIMVLGQAKAGKSSLINAIFGDVRAATDVLPCTKSIMPYMLEREGLPTAIIYDTIGFGGTDEKQAHAKLNEELEQCDLVIAVSSAATAAREADRKLLDDARLRLERRTRQAVPPIVVALSHIDMVRPIAEWSPPYDFSAGPSTKERNVRDAMLVVAHDLQVPVDRVVPVCLREGAVYNVDEALLPALMLVMPEAERAKLLRVLMEDRGAQQREDLKRLLVKAGTAAADLAILAARRSVGGRGA
jgi:uncharacterized protein